MQAAGGRRGRGLMLRVICEIAWLVASEHLYSLNNLGLGIGSDGLCQISRVRRPCRRLRRPPPRQHRIVRHAVRAGQDAVGEAPQARPS